MCGGNYTHAKPKIKLRVATLQPSGNLVCAWMSATAHATLHEAYPNQPRLISDHIVIGIKKPKIKLRMRRYEIDDELYAQIDQFSYIKLCAIYSWPVAKAYGIGKYLMVGVKR